MSSYLRKKLDFFVELLVFDDGGKLVIAAKTNINSDDIKKESTTFFKFVMLLFMLIRLVVFPTY